LLEHLFNYLFIAGLVTASSIRSVYGRRHKRTEIATSFKEPLLVWPFLALWGLSQIIPFFYIFTNWLDFASYDLPVWVKSIGAVIFFFGVWLLFRSHEDLGRNWRPTLEIVEEHTLVTNGVYRRIRHPMYAAHLLYSLGQGLLLNNWLAGWLALITFIPIYYLRVPGEENMLSERFGRDYSSYSAETGRVFPRLSWRN
jgi:protein-S-isoprenylcysteine O-methyltransferase Ste14